MKPSVKVGVIDLGSNSTKVLVASVSNDGDVQKIREKSFPCRLINLESIEDGRISRKIQEDLFQILSNLLKACEEEHAQYVTMVATEAMRKAPNSKLLVDEIQSRFSHPLHILSGNEEAALIAEGLLQDPQLSGCDSFQAFDLGGGSLELIQMQDRCPTLNNSLPLGVLSVSNQLTSGNQFPLSAKDIKSLRDVVCNEVRNCDFILDPGIPLIGLGGAIFFIRKILSRCRPFDFHKCQEFQFREISELAEHSSRLSMKERLAEYPELPVDRGDVFPIACLIIEEMMKVLSKSFLLHSQYNLRFGVASRLGRGEWAR